jgi:hypothetical protein
VGENRNRLRDDARTMTTGSKADLSMSGFTTVSGGWRRRVLRAPGGAAERAV